MRNKENKYITILIVIFFIIIMLLLNSLYNKKDKVKNNNYKKIKEKINENKYSFENFLLKIQELESNYNHKAINGQYWGLYQLGTQIRKKFNCNYSKDEFLNNVNLQHKCMIESIKFYKKYLSNLIKKYNNKIIDGILITESSIIALAHLAGIGGVKNYLKSNNIPHTDKYGNKIRKYVIETSNYDISLKSIIYVDTNKLSKKIKQL